MGKFSKFDGQILTAGDILHHDFERQTDNYRALYKILRRNGLFFQNMELAILDGVGRVRGRKFVTFKAFAQHGAGQTQVSLDLSTTWTATRNMEFDVSANVGMTRDTPALEIVLGVTRRF